MTLRNSLAAAVLATVTITGAHAQKVPEMVETTAIRAAELCGDGGQKWSANEGFVGCTEVQPL